MKPEWPLYGLGAVLGTVLGVTSALFEWSYETERWVGFAALAVVLWTYLPLMARRRDSPKAHSTRG